MFTMIITVYKKKYCGNREMSIPMQVGLFYFHMIQEQKWWTLSNFFFPFPFGNKPINSYLPEIPKWELISRSIFFLSFYTHNSNNNNSCCTIRCSNLWFSIFFMLFCTFHLMPASSSSKEAMVTCIKSNLLLTSASLFINKLSMI